MTIDIEPLKKELGRRIDDEDTVTQVTLEFTDAAGRRWLRVFSGELLLVSEPRPPGRGRRWWHRSERLRRRRQRDRDWVRSVAPAVHPAAHPASGVAGVEDGSGLSTHHRAHREREDAHPFR